jgi:hypothetical protein
LQLWAANRVSDERVILKGLYEAAQAVAEAQSSDSPDAVAAFRSSSEEFQSALATAGSKAEEVLHRNGHSAGEEVLRRVRDILRVAVLRGGETWELLERGALMTEPSPGSEDVMGMFGAAAGPSVEQRAGRAKARREVEEAERAAAPTRSAEQALAFAQRLRERANEAAAAAEKAADLARAAEEEAGAAQEQAEQSRRALKAINAAP